MILNFILSTMYTRFLLPFALLLSLVACKHDPNANTTAPPTLAANTNSLGGPWIAIDFCARVAQYGSILQAEASAHRPFALALVFNPAKLDSVHCYNGMEDWTLPIKITEDTVELIGAKQGKSIFLIYDSQSNKYFTMFDGVSGQKTQIDKFLKSSVSSLDGHLAFTMAVNNHLFKGVFSPITAKGATQKVDFSPEGNIQGWPEYDHYSVCIGGDCFFMGNEMDIITLKNSKKEGSEKSFGFKYSGQNDTLSIMNIADSTPNEKGGYKTTGLAYRFLRKTITKK